MSKAAGTRRAAQDGAAMPANATLTPAEGLRARAAAAGEEIAEIMRRRASGEPLPVMIDYKGEHAALRTEIETLRAEATRLAARNSELERQLSGMTREAAPDDGDELRRRADALK